MRVWRHTGSPASPRRGKRASNAGMAARASMRESCAPGQKWVPSPKPKWGFGVRVRSSRPGEVKAAGSRLAGPMPSRHGLARSKRLAPELARLCDDAGHELRRAVPAHELLDGGHGERGVRAQPRELRRMSPEREHAVRDQADGRLVSPEDEHRAHGDDLERREPIAVVLRAEQPPDEVVARGIRTLRDELEKVRAELTEAARRVVAPVEAIHAAGDRTRERLEPPRSASGTSNSSAMTRIGSAYAKSATRSTSVAPVRPATSSSTIASMRGAIARTRGTSAALRSARTARQLGGSDEIVRRLAGGAGCGARDARRRSAENRSSSRSAAATPSWRKSTHARSFSLQRTGSAARRMAGRTAAFPALLGPHVCRDRPRHFADHEAPRSGESRMRIEDGTHGFRSEDRCHPAPRGSTLAGSIVLAARLLLGGDARAVLLQPGFDQVFIDDVAGQTRAWGIAVADFDDDGIDIVSGNTAGDVHLYTGNGDGTFVDRGVRIQHVVQRRVRSRRRGTSTGTPTSC